MRKLNYLSVWILPVSAWMSFPLTGFWSYLPLFIFFAILPLIEFFYPRGETNLSEEEILAVKKDPFYDLALYKLVPTQWVLLGYFLVSMNQEMGLIERIGRISSMGIM